MLRARTRKLKEGKRTRRGYIKQDDEGNRTEPGEKNGIKQMQRRTPNTTTRRDVDERREQKCI